MMADFMPKKDYDLTEITRLLLEMRDNCVPKAGDAHDDPKRAEKYEAINAAIFLINNPSMLAKWISVEDRLPEEGRSVLVHYVDGWMPVAHLLNGKWYQSGGETSWLSVTHWMPLPEVPKEDV